MVPDATKDPMINQGVLQKIPRPSVTSPSLRSVPARTSPPAQIRTSASTPLEIDSGSTDAAPAVDRTRSWILVTLGQNGPLSRAELARIGGITRTTIGTHVDRLIDDGLLEELDVVAPHGTRGRPSRPVWFHRTAARCGAVAFDRDRIEVGLVNAGGQILSRESAPTPNRADTGTFSEVIEGLLTRVVAVEPDLLGVGVGVSGVVHAEQGRVDRLPRFPEVDGDRLIRRVARAAGSSVLIENDAHCGAFAELWWGHGRLRRTFWAVQIGEGIGSCGVIDGELARGALGHAGEIGHTTVDRHGRRCACGAVGCWETIASLRWLRREARERGLRGARNVTVERLTDLAGSGDRVATGLLDAYAENIAVGLTNLIHVVAPALIVLQGAVADGGDVLLQRINHHVARRALAGADHGATILMSELGTDARLLGAGALVMSSTATATTTAEP